MIEVELARIVKQKEVEELGQLIEDAFKNDGLAKVWEPFGFAHSNRHDF